MSLTAGKFYLMKVAVMHDGRGILSSSSSVSEAVPWSESMEDAESELSPSKKISLRNLSNL
jgi:hypothetical protein